MPTFLDEPWQVRLPEIVTLMRNMSKLTDPQELVAYYQNWIKKATLHDGTISLSRRELIKPHYRVTRSHKWGATVNPWKDHDSLPILSSGILSEWIHSEFAGIVNDLKVPSDDPAYEHLEGMRSAMVLPLFEDGLAQNMVVALSRNPNNFDYEFLPEFIWLSNFFGRGTNNLRLSGMLREALEDSDRELASVAEIQRSLLPETLPHIAQLDLAAHYETSRQSGGDYYDFFPLSDGRWGLFMADVAGHSTAAAVLMAVTHSIAHAMPGEPDPPGSLLKFVNEQLCRRYTHNSKGTFVTAIYGIFNPKDLTFRYARAGHPPARIKRDGCTELFSLEEVGGIPLGILDDETYSETTFQLQPNDLLVLYTDGIIEARSPDGGLFGMERFDEILCQSGTTVESMRQSIIHAVDEYTGGLSPSDDRTLILARVR